MRMVRNVCEDDNHISEKALPDYRLHQNYYNSIIYNTGDLYALQRSAKATSEYIISTYDKESK